MRSISTLPVAAARATKSKTATPDGNEGVQVHRERRRCKLATLKAFRKLPTTHTATPRPRRSEVISRISGEAAGSVNTDISDRHAMTTKRAVPGESV
jgi:hypothetical protein